MKHTLLLFLELVFFFIVLPLLYVFNLIPFLKAVPLFFFFFYCVFILWKGKQFSFRQISFSGNWKYILLRLMIITLFSLALLYFLFPELLFSNLKDNTTFWFIVIVTYPIVSVYPQEIIYRKFFFYRYEKLFPNQNILFAVNVLLFSFVHIWFLNWVAIVLTLFAGILFAHTYQKTKSLAVVCIEHSLYGMLIFAVGLGEYFFRALTTH